MSQLKSIEFSLETIFETTESCSYIFKQATSSCDHLKHRIVQYTFLDMASYLGEGANGAEGDKWAAVLENLIKFPSAFSVPPSQIKLTQAGYKDHNYIFKWQFAVSIVIGSRPLGNFIPLNVK